MQLNLYNSLTNKIEPFISLSETKENLNNSKHIVGLYTCGPTVYSYAHIGNFRTYIFADVLKRALILFNYEVNHVMNITDVGHLTSDGDTGDDKMEIAAQKEQKTAWELADYYTGVFFEDAKDLNIIKANIVCKATDHIKEQIEMIQQIEKKDALYTTNDGVYFKTDSFPAYADFANLDIKGLQEGHRVEKGGKKQKTDFALWKFADKKVKRQMEWDSPWGRGFPGWHIECSAMATKYLGKQFDIHTGGVDHLNIHHTNEIAQAQTALDVNPWVKYWLHGEFILLENAPKMSKSTGNVLTVNSLKEDGIAPLAYRLLCLQSHYRKQLKLTKVNLQAAQSFYNKLKRNVKKILAEPEPCNIDDTQVNNFDSNFKKSIANDLNTPQAVALLVQMLESHELNNGDKANLIQKFDDMLGLDLVNQAKILDNDSSTELDIPTNLQSLLDKRNQARKDKDWKSADNYRNQINAAGYDIIDNKDKVTLQKRK